MNHDFFIVDAFTNQTLAGNPCPVIFDADHLTDSQMLALAKEMNQSETAFLMKSKSCDLRARYFTPEREIPLAGHPTIASIHAAIEGGLIQVTDKPKQISLELRDGPICVEVLSIDGQRMIQMHQRRPEFFDILDPHLVLPAFGLTLSDLLPGAPIQVVSTGTRQLMIPVCSHAALKKVKLDAESYLKLRDQYHFFSPHLFALGGISSDAQTFARHPCSPPETAEDAFTGSATGGMGAYLWKYGLLPQPKFIAEQGHWMGRPGRAWVEIEGPQHQISGVSVSGAACTLVRGTMKLSS